METTSTSNSLLPTSNSLLPTSTAAAPTAKEKETSKSPSQTTSTSTTACTHRRRLDPCCTTTAILLLTATLLITTSVLTVAFTTLKEHNPAITLDSATLASLNPSISLTPRGSLLLNATLHLDLLVLNPNRATFHHCMGSTFLFYRGSHVGSAELAPGTVPGKGSEHVACAVMAEAKKLEQEMGRVVKDVQRGELGFDAKSKIHGKLVILGLIKKKVSAESHCHVVVGLGPLRILRHHCSTGRS